MLTLEALLKEGTNILREKNIQEASLDAWLLLEYVTGKSRAYYFAQCCIRFIIDIFINMV